MSPMCGTESQMLMESSLSLVLLSAVCVLFRASCENQRISEFAMGEGKLFQDMIFFSCFTSNLVRLGEQILWILDRVML